MKATFNGALQLSVLDGWWDEAYDGSNGWAIPAHEGGEPAETDGRDAAAFYDLLEHEVMPLFHERGEDGVPQQWCGLVKAALRTCAPRFTATRMLDEYVDRIYGLPARTGAPAS
jgi:starch phosphorylase